MKAKNHRPLLQVEVYGSYLIFFNVVSVTSDPVLHSGICLSFDISILHSSIMHLLFCCYHTSDPSSSNVELPFKFLN